MFSKLATYPAANRKHAVRVAVAFAISNNDQRTSKVVHGARRGRPRLVCRWQPSPATGRPVCHWEIDAGDAVPVAPPAPSWQRGVLPLLGRDPDVPLPDFSATSYLACQSLSPRPSCWHAHVATSSTADTAFVAIGRIRDDGSNRTSRH